ncbi:porin family protein [Fulvivirga sediminis]|uniref:PorT family protein n=1 Tax=Fulvivirga sediminis TaxID=2803949 RepID=A0A937F865_9BACT|nr:porin family protein [Fulvivirga sediminis]MBL3656896.1 PorT family protein [Fulvivirga sediminis]
MKQINFKLGVVAVLLMLVGVKQASAQEARSGIKGGLNLSNLYVDDVDDENVRVGFTAGVYTQLMLGESFAIQPELLYATKGASTEYGSNDVFDIDGKADFNLNYIELPVLATFKLGDAVDINVGPYVSYLVGTSIDSDDDIFGENSYDLDRDDFKKFDYGLSGGVGFNFSAITLGARYNYGLAEIADSDDAEFFLGDAKNSSATVFVAFNLQ